MVASGSAESGPRSKPISVEIPSPLSILSFVVFLLINILIFSPSSLSIFFPPPHQYLHFHSFSLINNLICSLFLLSILSFVVVLPYQYSHLQSLSLHKYSHF
ncbi:unnamed protein product [Acanthosepion pharaonis]|uniref:Transmembrane protein n=1 Tax=Acanthosepion pharaonis TaxID=158019 RepID=A0A812BHU5_ACAPH|nr:unnamed protein product [Sepia pharaonis]